MKITLNKNADSVTPRRIMVQSFILCILLENVKIFDVMGASIKPIHVVMILSSLYCIVFEKMYIRDISIGMLFLALPLLPLYRINDLTEWLKSYVIYALMCVFLATAMRYFIAEIQVNYKKHLKLALLLCISKHIFMKSRCNSRNNIHIIRLINPQILSYCLKAFVNAESNALVNAHQYATHCFIGVMIGEN